MATVIGQYSGGGTSGGQGLVAHTCHKYSF